MQTATHTPSPDYLVRAALAWCRNNSKLDRLPDLALLDDLRPDPDTPAELGHATDQVLVRAALTDNGAVLRLSFRRRDDRVTHEFALPAAFQREAKALDVAAAK